MKRFFYISIMICTAAFLTSSCSSDDNDNLIKPEEGISVLTVGAPIITEDGRANTRMTFNDNNGLEMAWEIGDALQVSRYNSSDVREGSADYKAESAGSTSTFTPFGDAITTGDKYSIAYFANSTIGNPDGYTKKDDYMKGSSGDDMNKLTRWQRTFQVGNQKQAGNNSTAHLKNNYMCILQGITSGVNAPVFSSTWASTHGGNFYQSACLKLDLTLPTTSDYTGVSKVLIQTLGTDKKAENKINKNYDKSSVTSSVTLTMSGLTEMDFSSTKQNLVAYFMLSPGGISLTAGHYIQVRVYFGSDNKKYWCKNVAISTTQELNSGKLGVIKLNSSDWVIKE